MSKQPTVSDIYNFIDQIAPFETAETWDNVGLLIGSIDSTVSKVLLALDITEEVVNEAISGDFNVIITHHPIIFTGLKSITYENRIGSMLLKLIQHKISVIAAHTNIDRSFEFGINRTIANHYQLQMMQPLNALHRFGIVGILPEKIPFEAFIDQTKLIFNLNTVKVANIALDKGTRLIQTIALSSGASSDFIDDAIASNADVYITSDLKYHEAQTVLDTGLILVDVGHFESERIFLEPFKVILDTFANEKSFQLTVQVASTEKPIFNYL